MKATLAPIAALLLALFWLIALSDALDHLGGIQ